MSSSRVEKTENGLAFFGEIDHQTIPNLLRTMPTTNIDRPVLDLSATSKIDSAGLAMLIDWRNQHLGSEQKILIRGASQQLRQLIDILYLETVFEIVD